MHIANPGPFASRTGTSKKRSSPLRSTQPRGAFRGFSLACRGKSCPIEYDRGLLELR